MNGSGDNELCSPGTVLAQQYVDADRATALLKGVSLLYSQKAFTDVAIIVEGKEFQCHKNILASSSPYFMAMFSSHVIESIQNRVRIRDMTAATVSQILEYIYTGEVSLSEGSIQALLSAANFFQLLSLRSGCADFMIRYISVLNCVGVLFFAKAHQCDKLAQAAKDVINRKFPDVCLEKEFLDLPCEKLEEILDDDEICVPSERVVYEACLSWLNHKPERQKTDIFKVMKHVRFAIIDCYYFCDKIDSNSMLHTDLQMIKVLDSVKYYQMLRNRAAEVDLNLTPRRGMDYVRTLVILANPHSDGAASKCNKMEVLLLQEKSIRFFHKLPQNVFMPGTCITGYSVIYIAGGARRKLHIHSSSLAEDISRDLHAFDFNIGSWHLKSPMKMARSHFALTLVDNQIYAVGGSYHSTILQSVERYNMDNNYWVEVAPLPQPLRCMSSLSYRGSLYVFGGETDTEIVNTVYRYEAMEDLWIELTPMSCPRALAASIVYKDTLYVIGGNALITENWKRDLLPEHTISTVERYNPHNNTWGMAPVLPNPLCGAEAVRYGDTLLVIGGEDDQSWMAGTCGLQDEWKEIHELPAVMSMFGCLMANIPKDVLVLRSHIDAVNNHRF